MRTTTRRTTKRTVHRAKPAKALHRAKAVRGARRVLPSRSTMPEADQKAIAALLKGVRRKSDIDRPAVNAKIQKLGLEVPKGNSWNPIYKRAGIKL